MERKILDLLEEIIPNLSISENQFDEDLTVLGMDSISFIRLVVNLEDEFKCEISDSQLLISEMNTVNKIVSVLSTSGCKLK